MIRFLAIIFFLLLAGCQQWEGYRTQKQVETWRREALEKIDVQACTERGGTVRGVCMFGLPACVVEYSDAGKTCSDSAECEGDCRLQESRLPIGTKTTGFCTENNDPCGCWSQIEDGEVTETICAD